MTSLDVIADDVTGACDVGAELAVAGFSVRVVVDGSVADPPDGVVRVVNTQSRAVGASEAYARVLRVARRRPADLLLKKIDTALRGHLGAELDAAIDGLGAAAAFVVPAIPAIGRVTRNGRQWLGDTPLGETEFARDPEGHGTESSVAAVIARESRRRVELIGLDVLRAGTLPERARTLMRAGVDVFVVDAETDEDLATAARGILELPRPLCIAGSIGVAGALAAAVQPESTGEAGAQATMPGPAVVVSGSLHSMARAQIECVCDGGRAERLAVPVPCDRSATRALAERARALLAARRTVVLAPPETTASPALDERRAVERALADVAREALRTRDVAALVLIGGETSFAIFRALGATELAVHGRIAPLVPTATIVAGGGAGLRVVVKGGSGGAPDTLLRLLDDAPGARHAAM